MRTLQRGCPLGAVILKGLHRDRQVRNVGGDGAKIKKLTNLYVNGTNGGCFLWRRGDAAPAIQALVFAPCTRESAPPTAD